MVTSLSDQVIELEQTRKLVSSVFPLAAFRSSVKGFSVLATSCQQRASALFLLKMLSLIRLFTEHWLFFSDGMEVDIAPVVAGQFEDAEVDH